MAKSAIQKFFMDYASYHRTSGNQACHMVGVPLIMLTTLGILGAVSFFATTLGFCVWLGASVWYLWLDWRLGLPFSIVALGAYFIGRAIPLPVLGTLFVLGWVIQGVGHAVYEKKSPAFFKRTLHLLVGPLWVFAKILGYQAG